MVAREGENFLNIVPIQFAAGRFGDSIEINEIRLVATPFATEKADLLALCHTQQRKHGDLLHAGHEIGLHCDERWQRQ